MSLKIVVRDETKTDTSDITGLTISAFEAVTRELLDDEAVEPSA
jgi:hypothetical protein